MNVKYRVYITEYERGWGNRPDGFHDFDDKQSAVDFQSKHNAQNTAIYAPDIYWSASDPVLIDLDAVK